MALEKKADSLDRYVKAYETGDYSAALGAFRSAALDGSPGPSTTSVSCTVTARE